MRGLVIVVALLAAACGDNIKAQPRDDAGTDDAATPLTGCLDEPGLGIPMAPNGQLPCDLIPPGVTL